MFNVFALCVANKTNQDISLYVADVVNGANKRTNVVVFILAAVNTGTSLVLSSLLSVLVFAGMQMFNKQLASTEWLTILGGFLGSVLFICSLTVSSVPTGVIT